MKKTNKQRAAQLILSILIAVALWIYLDTELVTKTTLDVKNIPVEFADEHTTLADRGFMLLSGYDTTVDLKLEGSRNVLYELNEKAIRVVADTSSITSTGTQTLNYTVYYPRNGITTKSASADNITVTVGELYTKEVPVYCDVVGDVAGGYFMGEVSIDVSTISLHAQREELLNVSYAKVKVSASGAIDTITETLEYTLYDYNDVPVENSNIRSATKVIQVTVPVRTTKVIPLELNLVGGGTTTDAVDYEVSPQTVTLVGERKTLDSIASIVLDKLYVEDLQPYQTFTYDIKPPVGTTLSTDDPATALVTVSVNGAGERTLQVEGITCINVPDGFKATPLESTITVTVWGLQESLDTLESKDVQVSADLSEISEAGIHTVPVKIIVNGYEDIIPKGTYQVTVSVEVREPEETEDTQQTAKPSQNKDTQKKTT